MSSVVLRAAVLASLAVWWLNVVLTTRWADAAGSIHAARRPYFLLSLSILTVLALRQQRWGRTSMLHVWQITLAAAAGLLAIGFFCWFPPATWLQIPFLDNWVPRYQSTIDQVALMRRGAVAGWNWWFLGGYQLSSDLTQNLGVLAFPFILLFGPAPGFHLLHACLFASVPLLVYLDLRSEDGELAVLAATLACVLTAGYGFTAVRSGDTNSLAGVCTTALAVLAMGRALRGRREGPPILALALSLAACTHLGFFAYAVAYCGLQCLYYRDWRAGLTLAGGTGCAVLAMLPGMWENWTLPQYVTFNNVLLHPPDSFQWKPFARQVYYNVEILVRPGRWFNDYTTPIRLFLPVAVLLAIRPRGRVGFHAWAALATLALMTLNYAEFGFAFSRPFHMLPFFTAPVLAGFLIRHAGTRAFALIFVVTLSLFVNIVFTQVPHLNRLDDWNPALVARIRDDTAGMVLVENSPHLDMIESPTLTTAKTPFGVHFEPLLPASTGRRFYAGFWDGWQWTAFREHLLAAGAMRGRPIEDLRPEEIVVELRRWGIRDVFVWSPGAQQFFAQSLNFDRRWEAAPWIHFAMPGADTRAVVASAGTAVLRDLDPLGGRVELRDVDAGANVIVRTNYYPAWRAFDGSTEVELFSHDGQLAFNAPRSGSYDVRLEYPRRYLLTAVSMLAFSSGVAWMYFGRWFSRPAARLVTRDAAVDVLD